MKKAGRKTGNAPAAERKKQAAKPANAAADRAQLLRNLSQIGARVLKLLEDYLRRQNAPANGPYDPLNLTDTFAALIGRMAADPLPVVEAQARLWQDHSKLWEATANRLLGGAPAPVAAAHPADKRFRDKAWQENRIFDVIKQSYLLTAERMLEAVGKVEGLDPQARRRAIFYAKQFADALSPSNFALTNPEVLRATLRSNGENLVKGLDNLIADLERGNGRIAIRQTTDDFVVGRDLAVTPGKVVYRSALFELLQYAPATKQVYERPLLIFPPWINKYYIIDLSPENSFVRWLVGRGYTVFVVSWVNPDTKLADKSFEDYTHEGVFEALEAVEKATGVHDPNAVGYCIGGTLLAATLAYMAHTGDTRIHSATFWTAQVDFSEAGDLKVFIDEPQLAKLKKQMEDDGGLFEGRKMANTFNMLRANEMIWSFVVNNYLLGKSPPPFDMLHWNSDNTRMPQNMHLFYLRECYCRNTLAQGTMKFGDVALDLRRLEMPVYLQAAKEDHIAPAASVYKASGLYKGAVRFVLAGSGHVAGVVNPPAKGKYQYWTNEELPPTFDAWFAGAAEHQGSWWPDWDAWLAKHSGRKVPARHPGQGKLKALCDAPGEYVKAMA